MKDQKEIKKIINYLSIEKLDLKEDKFLFQYDNIFYIQLNDAFESNIIKIILQFYADQYDIDIMSFQINSFYQCDIFVIEFIILELNN